MPTSFKKTLRKNLGEKNCEIDKDIREYILELYMAFDQADERYSKVFNNSEFGYWKFRSTHRSMMKMVSRFWIRKVSR